MAGQRGERKHERKVLQTRAEAESASKDVAGKAIGKHGLLYITVILLVGVVSSVFLDEAKIAAVIGLVSAALTALIAMLSGIAEAEPAKSNPELEIIRQLIANQDRDPMTVEVSGDRVVINRGGHEAVRLDRPDTEG